MKRVSFKVINISSDIYFEIFSFNYFEKIDRVKLACINTLIFID